MCVCKVSNKAFLPPLSTRLLRLVVSILLVTSGAQYYDKVAQKRLTESNGTPAMDFGLEKYVNVRGAVSRSDSCNGITRENSSRKHQRCGQLE